MIKEIELVWLIDGEAEAVEEAEATSDPNEPLPPHVAVTRGRSPRADEHWPPSGQPCSVELLLKPRTAPMGLAQLRDQVVDLG